MTAGFAARWVPEVHFGAGRAGAIADDAAALGDSRKPVVLVSDAALVEFGVAGRLLASLEAAGAACATFAEIAGEPKQAQLEAATDFVRRHDAGLVM
jgi:alcohol dehydrogenase class IV